MQAKWGGRIKGWKTGQLTVSTKGVIGRGRTNGSWAWGNSLRVTKSELRDLPVVYFIRSFSNPAINDYGGRLARSTAA